MEKKFELTEETQIAINGVALHRIRALRDFNDVKKGDLGGWVKKEENLSHEGNCWIYDNATVGNDALVSDNARIYDMALVVNNARMYHNSQMRGHACMCDNAQMHDNAQMSGNS